MCGIVGYLGKRTALPILMDGLKRLEYRGYDSAGVALLKGDRLVVRKKAGKISELEKACRFDGFGATVGMGHTRWATHGEPTDGNAHPHTDCAGHIAVIHNGIIENCTSLKNKLLASGHTFRSETDTEVLAHLIEDQVLRTDDLDSAVRTALQDVVGTYGLIVMSDLSPGRLIVARKGSPLVIGVGRGEFIVASDAAAIIEHTRDVIYLDNDEMAVISSDGICTKTLDNILTQKDVEEVLFDLD
ncbi:MAG: glutamine--fructose-6-phosphate transaminase (isomerizing), partial [Bacteroidota bacterium]